MNVYTRSLGYFKADRWRIAGSLGMAAAMTLLGLAAPLTLGILIDLFTPEASRDTWVHRLFSWAVPSDDRVTQIAALTAITLVLRLLKELLQMYQTMLNIHVGYSGLMAVRCDLFRKLQELSIGYHRAQPQGDAIYRLSWDTFGFQSIYNIFFGGFVNVMTLLYMMVVMLSLNWQLTLVALAVVPALLWAIRRFGKVMQERSTAAAEADSALTTTIQRSVASISLVQAFNRQSDEYRRFDSTVRNSVAARMKLHWQEVMYWLVLGVIFTLGATVIFGYGGYLVHRGDLSIGMLSVFLSLLAGLYDPLNKLSASGSSLQGGVAGAKRVFEVLDLEPTIHDSPGAAPLALSARTIRFENVSFAYKHNAPVLREVSFEITPGQMVAFVGSSGVGKTTLLSILPRFYDPTSGVFRLDSHDVRSIRLRDLRRHVALVLQESPILPTTVAENIAYGRPDATPAEIRDAAELAGALPFIEKLEQGFNTEISESGSNLSGGQRQRIAIARALVTQAPILVLDEPTSALDPATEQLITETLRSLKRTRTIIIVSHRLSTVLDCDRIYVMDEGRIVEQGTHDELVGAGGAYYRMAKHQLRLDEKPAAGARAEAPDAVV